MATVLAATFVRLLPSDVELRTADGRPALLPRPEIEYPRLLDHSDDAAVNSYFARNPRVLVVCSASGDGEPLAATRVPFQQDRRLTAMMDLKMGEPHHMVIRDTNSRLYAYGDMDGARSGRCEKAAIRRYLQARRVLPTILPESTRLTVDDLLDANVVDEEFWTKYYGEYELHPGDELVGCLVGIDYQPTEDLCEAILDVPMYLERLRADPMDILSRFGYRSGVRVPAPRPPSVPEGLVPGTTMPVRAYKLLFVDDDADKMLRLVKPLLERDGFDVTTYSSAEDAERRVSELLRKPDNGMFDLAVIDIHLDPTAGGNEYRGIKFARWLQNRMPSCAITLISAEGPQTNGGKPAAAGDLQIVDYVPKPIKAGRFRALLEAAGRKQRRLARDILGSDNDAAGDVQKRLVECRRGALGQIEQVLGRLREEISADLVAVFRMHTRTREAYIQAYSGKQFYRYDSGRRGLRYSPVRDVCEDLESWCHTDVPRQFADKHQNLLNLCDPHRQYEICIACPVPAPPGDQHWYSLFAFVFPTGQPGATLLSIPGRLRGLLQPAQAHRVSEYLALHSVREYAAYVAQHLFAHWHETMQVRQHPFLMMGMAGSSMGHDLANALMGADHAIAGLRQRLAAGRAVTDVDMTDLADLATLSDRAIDIASTLSKQARAHEEKPAKVSVADLVLRACQAVMFEAKKNEVDVQCEPGPPVEVICQRGALDRILVNVILNAVQQTGLSLRKRGFVGVSYGVRPCKRGQELFIRVYDSGTGVHGFRRETIFEPGETTRADGSGMGLSICRQELHNISGSVHLAQTALFCGSCFEVVLPPKVLA